MFPIIEAFQASQLKRQEFADRHGLPVSVLDYWRRRYEAERSDTPGAEGGGFVEVRPGTEPTASESNLEIFLPNGTHVCYNGPDAQALLLRIVGTSA